MSNGLRAGINLLPVRNRQKPGIASNVALAIGTNGSPGLCQLQTGSTL